MRTAFLFVFILFKLTLSTGQTLLDESYLQNCIPKIGIISCGGKVYLARNGGYGIKFFPNNIHGLPAGRKPDEPQYKANELLSLGSGGWVTMKFEKPVYNESGPDIRIFENPFFVRNAMTGEIMRFVSFTETAYVEVSQDGIDFYRFPASLDTSSADYFVNPYNFQNLAGVFPVYANSNVDAFGPQVYLQDGTRKLASGPGGDDFDLDDLKINLDWIQYVRVIDTNGAIRDSGDHVGGNPTGGFDLDAIVGLN